MTTSHIQRRIALARIEAALIRTGFSEHSDVAVRIAENEEPDDVKTALEAVCLATPSLTNHVVLQKLYNNDRPTHAVAAAEVVDIPKGILDSLETIRKGLLAGKAPFNSAIDIGWSIYAERLNASDFRIVLRVSAKRAPTLQRQLAGLANLFSQSLGLPVRLEAGLISSVHADNWAHKARNHAAPGMSIAGTDTQLIAKAATITVPVRPRGIDRDEFPTKGPANHFLTAGHALVEGLLIPPENTRVRQPARDTDIDRVIGTLKHIAYNPLYSGTNLIDAAVVATSLVPAFQFGTESRYQINGIWTGDISPDSHVFIYGATSGFIRIRIDGGADSITTMLSLSLRRLIYRDVFVFSNDKDDGKPASEAGDSGAPVLIRDAGKYYLVGIVIGGDSNRAESRKPKSYAVPIGRVLRHFDLAIF